MAQNSVHFCESCCYPPVNQGHKVTLLLHYASNFRVFMIRIDNGIDENNIAKSYNDIV